MKNRLLKQLKKYYPLPIQDIKIAIKYIIQDVLKITLIDLYSKNYKVNFFNYFRIIKKIKIFIKGKPLAYILNKITILNKEIFINKNVLIPRQETEELISESIKQINDYLGEDKKIIFDICTGSLLIALLLFNNLKNISEIYANDISLKALRVAKKNNKLFANNEIKIIKSNILDFYLQNNLKCNILICNPPYIAKDDKEIIYSKEPKIALYAKNNGLYFYQEILKKIKIVCLPKSIVIFEIGYNQKKEIEKIILKYLPNSKFNFQKDMSGKWRFLYIYNNFEKINLSI